jgi:hypothetical protein
MPLYRHEAERKPAGMVSKAKSNWGNTRTAKEVYAQLIGSCDAKRWKHLILASQTWCNSSQGFHCSVYLDVDCKAELPTRVKRSIKLVAPQEYMTKVSLPSCCNTDVVVDPLVLKQPSLSTWDGMGPSLFYCVPSRKLTHVHQFRYLPALEHGRQQNMQRLQSGELKWFVQLDDDSVVNVPRLLSLLSGHDPTSRLQLGDFVHSFQNSTHWTRPFACGGAGTIFSSAAMIATDFGSCATRYSTSCLQSDWMIGMCAGLHSVVPITEYSCG